MSIVQEILKEDTSLLSMEGFLKNQIDIKEKKLNDLLNKSHKAVDDGMPVYSKKYSDIAERIKKEIDSLKNRLKKFKS